MDPFRPGLDLELRQLLTEPGAHFSTQRLQTAERTHHELKLTGQAVFVKADHGARRGP